MRVSARPYPSPLDVTFSRVVPDGGLERDIIVHHDKLLEKIDRQVMNGLSVMGRDEMPEFASVNNAIEWIIAEADRRQAELNHVNDKLSRLKERNSSAYHCTTKDQVELAVKVTERLKRALRDVGIAKGSSKNFDEAYAIAVRVCETIEALIPPIDLTTADQQTNQQQ